MYCTNCGNEIKDGARFCTFCGAEVTNGADTGRAAERSNEAAPRREPDYRREAAPRREPDYRREADPRREPARMDPGRRSGAYGAENTNRGRSYEEQPKRNNLPLIIAAVIASLVLVGSLGALGAMHFMNKKSDQAAAESSMQAPEDDLQENEAAAAAGETAALSAETGAAAENSQDITDSQAQEAPSQEGVLSDDTFQEAQEPSPNALTVSDSPRAQQIAQLNAAGASMNEIHIYEENYQPKERDYHRSWNRDLFYKLEDVSPDSPEDGQINRYTVSRKIMRNADTGNRIEYEIYTRPEDGIVNKIVSIEYYNDYLELTDYYYSDKGKINFIFMREDINYVPSYATPAKDGQRFYFSKDNMVKWRTVTGGVVNNWVIGSESASENTVGQAVKYKSLDSDEQESYDQMERRMINAAYNTYNIVLNAVGVCEITGYIQDENGVYMPDSEVWLMQGEEALYEAVTDVNGEYTICVPAETADYSLRVRHGDYYELTVYLISVNEEVTYNYIEPVTMTRVDSPSTTVTLQVRDALNYASDGHSMMPIGNADVYLRWGANCREGDILWSGITNAYGDLAVTLVPGMYTAEVRKAGYEIIFMTITVTMNMQFAEIHSSPSLDAGEIRIVLSWGTYPEDLDSHLFTPYDSSLGDSGYHIWYGHMMDEAYDSLDVDDTSSYGPETVTIPVLKNGLYKYYVADYTNCSRGNPTSNEMSYSGAVVNVYTSNGLTATFHVPYNRSGVIWEVFEIRNGQIVPNMRYYNNIDNTSWWHDEK